MSQASAIEWTDATWNPTTGCRKVSPGCDNCYAATLAKRLKAMGNVRYQNDGPDGAGFGLTLHWDKIDEPLRWMKPKRVFVNSMSDLFHPSVPMEFLLRCFEVMIEADGHRFQILTKRPTYMARAIPRMLDKLGLSDPPRNVWLGTSVENQEWADKRIPPLVGTPAFVRFLSCEPLLAPIDLRPFLAPRRNRRHGSLHWVIVGGESGPNHRPFDPSWARSIRDQCREASVPFFFKQIGGRTPKAGGRELDGQTYDEFPTPESADAVPA
jgi:protein gp37